jgi:hypothetical protein
MGPLKTPAKQPYKLCNRAGCDNYQTLINDALRGHISDAHRQLKLTSRKIVRGELRAAAYCIDWFYG